MVLVLEATIRQREQLRQWSRGATGGWARFAARLVDGFVRVEDDRYCVRLPLWSDVARFRRQRDTGDGGWQRLLRSLQARLLLDDGSELTEWTRISRVIFEAERAEGVQLPLAWQSCDASCVG